MKAVKNNLLGTIFAGVVASVMSISVEAATVPTKITTFTNVLTTDVFSVKAKGWSDPAFGDMGWTHSSAWGIFTATKGQTVSIILKADDKGIHPGSTIWYRGDNDTAPDQYVVDHFYPQNANFAKFAAVTEDTGEKLGNIVMKYVTHAYDLDNNSISDLTLKGRKDGVAGRLNISFKAPYTGTYMFVVGGFNPDTNITDLKASYNVNVQVTVK